MLGPNAPSMMVPTAFQRHYCCIGLRIGCHFPAPSPGSRRLSLRGPHPDAHVPPPRGITRQGEYGKNLGAHSGAQGLNDRAVVMTTTRVPSWPRRAVRCRSARQAISHDCLPCFGLCPSASAHLQDLDPGITPRRQPRGPAPSALVGAGEAQGIEREHSLAERDPCATSRGLASTHLKNPSRPSHRAGFAKPAGLA